MWTLGNKHGGTIISHICLHVLNYLSVFADVHGPAEACSRHLLHMPVHPYYRLCKHHASQGLLCSRQRSTECVRLSSQYRHDVSCCLSGRRVLRWLARARIRQVNVAASLISLEMSDRLQSPRHMCVCVSECVCARADIFALFVVQVFTIASGVGIITSFWRVSHLFKRTKITSSKPLKVLNCLPPMYR